MRVIHVINGERLTREELLAKHSDKLNEMAFRITKKLLQYSGYEIRRS